MDNAELKAKLKQEIVEFLNLTHIDPATIEDDAPLFGEGLGLDSIDSIELMVMLSRNYGVDIKDPKEGRKVLASVQTIADYINELQAQG